MGLHGHLVSTVRGLVRSASRALLVGLSLLLVGCGGGGSIGDSGGSQEANPPNSPTPGQSPDATAPALRATETPCGDVPPTATAQPSSPPSPPPVQPTPGSPVTAVPPYDVDFPGCEAVMAEDNYCLTTAGTHVYLLGLDSGQLCPVTQMTTFQGGDTASIAWLGDEMYACPYDTGLMRVSLRDGSTAIAGVPCTAVTDYRGELLVSTWPSGSFGDAPLRRYQDLAHAQHGEPDATYALGEWSERMTVSGDTFVGAWHSTDHVDIGSLHTDQALGVLTLEQYDGWVYGLSVTNDGLLALAGPGDTALGGAVAIFDLATGRRVRTLQVDAELAGLACTSRVHREPLWTVTPAPTSTPAPNPSGCVPQFGDDDVAPVLACPPYDCAALPTPVRPDYPPSQPNESCRDGYGTSNYARPAASDDATAELHVIGVYEATGAPGFRPEERGMVEVVVHPRPKPVVLFLSSYESVSWRVTLEAGAELAKVIAQGYAAPEVTGVPDTVPIERRGWDQVCGYAYGWEVEHNSGGGNYAQMIASARDLTGLTESSFQGCYDGDRFEVPYWGDEPPPTGTPTPVPGDETIPSHAVGFPGCESVTAEQHYCLTTTCGGIALVGLDSGRVCGLTTTSAGVGDPLVSSIAWRGELMYACTGAGLVRISLRDGSWEAAQVACGGVAEYDGGLLLAPSLFDPSGWQDSPLRAFPDYAAVLRGEPDRVFTVGGSSTRFTVHGETFYGAWHASDTIDVADLSADAPRDAIRLEDYDGWILGLAVTDDGQLIISGDTWGDTIRRYDATTGALLGEVHPTTSVYGLSCVTNASH